MANDTSPTAEVKPDHPAPHYGRCIVCRAEYEWNPDRRRWECRDADRELECAEEELRDAQQLLRDARDHKRQGHD